ncbi:hypothetical protein Bca52824_053303 [Brassica carinata]|uniref:Uncharacterized protein n=1 Tax=Brassica carinata TaxID=52824 RepID=A0A8X7R3M0_BRACI|nr:hypothetical protein Bca52824_053303 [Brassica carinata]
MATSESGKLITCGSTNDLGQSYVTSGKHCKTPEPFPLPPEVCVQKAEAGWDHCVAITCDFLDSHEVYTWGWKECIPTGRVFGQVEGDSCEMNTSFSAEQGKSLLHVKISHVMTGLISHVPSASRSFNAGSHLPHVHHVMM